MSTKVKGEGPVDSRERTSVVNEGRDEAVWKIETDRAVRAKSCAPPGGGVIGKGLRKVEGAAKAIGRAVYADDIARPGMLHGKILRSPHAHARIKSIDYSEALALEGVEGVITGKDLPGTYGITAFFFFADHNFKIIHNISEVIFDIFLNTYLTSNITTLLFGYVEIVNIITCYFMPFFIY